MPEERMSTPASREAARPDAREPVREPAREEKKKLDRTKGTHEVVIERYGYGDDALVEGDRVSDDDTPYDLDDAVKGGAVRKVPRDER